MINEKEFVLKAQKKINELNKIAHSKGQRGTLKPNEYRYMTAVKVDHMGRAVCLTCGAGVKDNLVELAQVEEYKGYTASNVLPVCKSCWETSRGKDLHAWYNEGFKGYDLNRLHFIKQKIVHHKKIFRG